MIYLNEDHISRLGIDWRETIDVIGSSVKLIDAEDYVQPIKPYLRYGNPANRIIAMPAYVGGEFRKAGIKWIASFPDNVSKGLPRAHSIVILNNSETGEPEAIINTALLSIIRTASVSGLMIRHDISDRRHPGSKLKAGIIGWGPIGRYHYEMVCRSFGKWMEEIRLFDLRDIDKSTVIRHEGIPARVVSSWREAYEDADILITCTVTKERYIDLMPKRGALLLNVSLRDFCSEVYPSVQGGIFVDNWAEVCRENTDIEFFHKTCGLQEEGTGTIADVAVRGALGRISPEQAVMFNPMGMAAFDIAIGAYYLNLSRLRKDGLELA